MRGPGRVGGLRTPQEFPRLDAGPFGSSITGKQMRWFRSIAVLSAVVVAVAATGAPASGAAPRDRSFTFRLDTPPIEALPADDGFVDLRVEGFDTRSRIEGAPDVPTRTVLVALPPGASPRLSVRVVGSPARRALRPRPVPRWVIDPAGDDLEFDTAITTTRDLLGRTVREHYEAAEAHYSGEGTLPPSAARLGSIGVLRDQRYVEVHLAPVRFDRGRGDLVVDPGLEVTVHFDGAFEVTDAPAPLDRLESVYRTSLENYAQGRRFRLSALDARMATAVEATRGDFASTGPVGRIRIRANGPVRLDHASVSTHLPDFLGTDPGKWFLTNRGEQVPLQVHQGGVDDAVFEVGEWVQFYGQALDDEPETILNYEKPANPIENLHEVSDFSDENVYFLTLDSQPQPAMTERAAPPHGATPATDFGAVARTEVDTSYVPLPGEVWFWAPFTAEGNTRTEIVSLPGLASGTAPARFRVLIRGLPFDCSEVDPDHRSLIGLKNSSAQTLVLPAGNPDNVGNRNVGEFDGNTLFLHDFEWVHATSDPVLTDPVRINLKADDFDVPCAWIPGGNVINDVILDSIEIEYRRVFGAQDDALVFSYPDGAAEFEITGFASGAVEVYEVTGRIGSSGVVDAVRLTGATVLPDGPTHTVRFHVEQDPALEDGTPREFVVAGHDHIPTAGAGDLDPDRTSTLATDATHAGMVVIAHPDLLDSTCSEGGNACQYDVDCTSSPTDRCEIASGSVLDLLLDHRAGQNIPARVARIQDIEDDFNHGLAGPGAIKRFLEWLAAGGWGAPPAYVMLLGDGSYDYKGGTDAGNFVPTQMMVKLSEHLAYFASDNLLAAVAGDDYLADMTVGRISVRSRAEADGVLQKILDYEQVAPPGLWRSHMLFISDAGKDYDPEEGLAFEAMNDLAGSYLDETAYTSTHLRYWTDNCCGGQAEGCTPFNQQCHPEIMNQDILDAVNGIGSESPVIAEFVGHGNFDLWSDDVIFCGNEGSGYCAQDDTLRLGFRFIGTEVIEIIWNDVFGPHQERVLGIPVLNSQVKLCTQQSIEACQYYTLLGDPTTRLALPHVGPPTLATATASSGVEVFVDLAWEPSATVGATYDVYRTLQLDLAYTRIQDGIVATSFTDHDVEPTLDYYYYVVAVEGGFQSAWSNFNTGCDEEPATDCLHARPVNLVPPVVPSGLTVTDAETGGRLDVAWLPNPEEEFIRSYTVHYGTTAAYGQTQTVLVGTETSLAGLEDGQTYYVAIQATNTTGTESEISDPAVQAVPHLILGLRAPDRIADLRLEKSGSEGSDALLSWSPVTQDIYGKPKSVSHYEIFRGTIPQFVPVQESPHRTAIGTTFPDGGALVGADPYFYLVRAVDAAGGVGGLGNQLPRGILDLAVASSSTTPGAIALSWSAVTTDFDDLPIDITHYEVYGADAPFGRGEIGGAGINLVVPAVAATAVDPVPAGPERYYSVLAVDARGNRSPF